MSVHLLDAMAREGFEEVVALHDRDSGLRAFLAVHDTTRGPAFGGVRRWDYRDERSALGDCLRLARAMTHKCALADLPAGGAKVVVLDRDGVDWPAAYAHLGRVVERLGGRYYSGPDVNTGPDELRHMCAHTRYVTDPGPEGPGALVESTSEGVFRGIEACLVHLDGEADWARRRVVVQGLGAVGRALSERLRSLGTTVVAADVDAERAERVARELDLEVVDPGAVLDQRGDVFAPCALGGILHDLSVERLNVRAVAGAANNQLAKALHGDRLHVREVLYAPDFAVNSGALIRGTYFHLEGRRVPAEDIGLRIGEVLGRVFEASAAEDEPPARVARRLAEERVAAWRANGDA